MIASGCGMSGKAKTTAEAELEYWRADRTGQARDNAKGADSGYTSEGVEGLTGDIAGGSRVAAGEASIPVAGEDSRQTIPEEGEEQNDGSTSIDRSRGCCGVDGDLADAQR